MKQIKWLSACLLSAGLAIAAPAVLSQEFPSRPIRFIVPLPPGNPFETHFRLVANKMAERMGVTAVVENRPGGNGVPAVVAMMQAPADGYTVLDVFSQVTITQYLMKDPPYDVRRDLVPLAQIGYTPLAVSVQSGINVKTWAELVAYAKAQPKKLTYGGFGGGTSLVGAELLILKGLNAVFVPYKDPTAPLLDLIGGRVDMVSGGPNDQLPYAKEGKLRPLIVLSTSRVPAMPNVPTAVEATGDQELGFTTWLAGSVRAGTPKNIVDKLEREMVDAAKSADIQAFSVKNAMVPEVQNAEGLRKIWEADLKRWEKVIRDAKIAVN